MGCVGSGRGWAFRCYVLDDIPFPSIGHATLMNENEYEMCVCQCEMLLLLFITALYCLLHPFPNIPLVSATSKIMTLNTLNPKFHLPYFSLRLYSTISGQSNRTS